LVASRPISVFCLRSAQFCLIRARSPLTSHFPPSSACMRLCPVGPSHQIRLPRAGRNRTDRDRSPEDPQLSHIATTPRFCRSLHQRRSLPPQPFWPISLGGLYGHASGFPLLFYRPSIHRCCRANREVAEKKMASLSLQVHPPWSNSAE
jgi:hypothetical protein